MINDLAGFDVNFQSLTLAGFGIVAVLSLLRGWLLPKSIVDSLLKAKDETIEALEATIKAYESAQAPAEKLYTTLNQQAEKAVSDGT
ncbi:hypothetical protein [Cellulosimicrobium phage DS1]|nr:hypothetical protein [Cellulosimicrobium phage DS1]